MSISAKEARNLYYSQILQLDPLLYSDGRSKFRSQVAQTDPALASHPVDEFIRDLYLAVEGQHAPSKEKALQRLNTTLEYQPVLALAREWAESGYTASASPQRTLEFLESGRSAADGLPAKRMLNEAIVHDERQEWLAIATQAMAKIFCDKILSQIVSLRMQQISDIPGPIDTTDPGFINIALQKVPSAWSQLLYRTDALAKAYLDGNHYDFSKLADWVGQLPPNPLTPEVIQHNERALKKTLATIRSTLTGRTLPRWQQSFNGAIILDGQSRVAGFSLEKTSDGEEAGISGASIPYQITPEGLLTIDESGLEYVNEFHRQATVRAKQFLDALQAKEPGEMSTNHHVNNASRLISEPSQSGDFSASSAASSLIQPPAGPPIEFDSAGQGKVPEAFHNMRIMAGGSLEHGRSPVSPLFRPSYIAAIQTSSVQVKPEKLVERAAFLSTRHRRRIKANLGKRRRSSLTRARKLNHLGLQRTRSHQASRCARRASAFRTS